MDNNGIKGLEQFDNLMRELKRMGKSIDDLTTEKALRAGAKILKEKVINHPNLPVSNDLKKHARDDIKIKKIDEELFEVGYPANSKNSYYLYFYEVGTQAGTYLGDDGKYVYSTNYQCSTIYATIF